MMNCDVEMSSIIILTKICYYIFGNSHHAILKNNMNFVERIKIWMYTRQ